MPKKKKQTIITPKFKLWIKAAGIRAIKTMAQTTLASILPTAKAMGEVDWALIGSTALLAGILSLITSIAGLPEVEMEERENELKETRKINGQDS